MAVRKPLLGIVCGMQSEVDVLDGWITDPRIELAVSGARPDLAEDGARWLVDQGCRHLVSFGLAGGLAPDAEPGMRIDAATVRTEGGERYHTATDGPHIVLGADRMILDATEKARLHAATGAVAVDMESHRVARVAQDAGIPITLLRVIGDPASQSLPPFVGTALSATGHPRIRPVLLGLAMAPGWLPDLLRLKKNTEIGLKALKAAIDAGALTRCIPSNRPSA